jgi:hypothetical protein
MMKKNYIKPKNIHLSGILHVGIATNARIFIRAFVAIFKIQHVDKILTLHSHE